MTAGRTRPRPSCGACFLAGVLLALCNTHAQLGADPFAVDSQRIRKGTQDVVRITIQVPQNHFLYAEQTRITPGPAVSWRLDREPAGTRKKDPFSDETVRVYMKDAVFMFTLLRPLPPNAEATVAYQGCSESVCFLPQQKTVALGETLDEPDDRADTSLVPEPDGPSQDPATGRVSWQTLLETHYTIDASATGYVEASDFIAFLENARKGQTADQSRLQAIFDEQGLWVAMLFILAGGLLLNLTPCVLPMIPVNLAVIGAGAQAASRTRGFLLGGAYGLGIALVYGILGLVALLTGTRFGTLNSLPWFNLGVAVIFVLLSLAMFDVIHIDFSRWQTKAGPAKPRRGSFLTALLLGGIAALLAGACVAPVVIGVLLLAADLVARDMPAGMLLPFLLGIGMALPWPFAGAGLSFLPKPGKWMERVKFVFGIVILLMALYYGQLGVRQWLSRRPASREAVADAQSSAAEHGWETDLGTALRRGLAEDKPVFLDFWATWCKNCLKMNKTTFKDPEVLSALDHYVKAKIQAEDIAAPDTRAMLDRFDVLGLPTYVVLRRQAEPAPEP